MLFDVAFGLLYAFVFFGTFPAFIWVKTYFKFPSFIVATLTMEQVCMFTFF